MQKKKRRQSVPHDRTSHRRSHSKESVSKETMAQAFEQAFTLAKADRPSGSGDGPCTASTSHRKSVKDSTPPVRRPRESAQEDNHKSKAAQRPVPERNVPKKRVSKTIKVDPTPERKTKKPVAGPNSRKVAPSPVSKTIWKATGGGRTLNVRVSPRNTKQSKGEKSVVRARNRSASHPGASVQCHQGRYDQERDLVIGFDFGTSCTKVVLQDTILKKAYAIPFDGLGCPNNPFLLPACVTVEPNGRLSLCGSGCRIGNIKTHLMENEAKALFASAENDAVATGQELAAGYAGLVLREVRGWLWRNKHDEYQKINIVWQLNIGLPARSYDDEDLYRTFRAIALAGWELSLQDGDIVLDHAGDALRRAQAVLSEPSSKPELGESDLLHPDFVDAVPEVIAEVIGYARSTSRQNGMYLLVDVGASTMDVSTFILHEKEGEDLFSILSAEVTALGTLDLHKRRLQHVVEQMENHLSDLSSFDTGNSPLPDTEAYFGFPRTPNFATVDGDFQKECSICLAKVVSHTKRQRNPSASEWDSGLPVFMSGGGAQSYQHQLATEEAEKRLRSIGVEAFRAIDLPKPNDMEARGMLSNNYHRLGVAYGLSFARLDMGEIIPPRLLGDIEPEHRWVDLDARFVDKDLV